jgi:hypothetical protein
MTGDSRICRVCREPMAAEAKRCPRCQTWRSSWATFWLGNTTQPFGQQLVVLVVMLVAMWAGFRFFLHPSGKDFQHHRGDLVFTSQSMTFLKERERDHFAVVGTIRNNSDVTWQDPYVEARFLNSKDELIDTYSSQLRDVIIRPRADAAFRLTGYTARPSAEYSKVVLSITSAKEKSWRDW